ncbi:hypothetical protein [Streptobacillus moniliformis]|uniref:FG-GAP repeat protein n=1 Tax=Streptobacillus moniliformis (strain ATCC 14647 / DSM 12112 / NCTC 10651 / 9901) TaxID=519441 RepID=D1AVK5_STRM9|nr:hypothetical protein [Streptobacillus moniliformis]ACZ01765.1 FG-GAP repeat protein [Streptobacillus moniliformis DSM 12112]AVL43239.1 hypothetical protein CEP89_05155 [Streptobacillus moniliformis]QXW65098.1 hypothetical protein KX935_04440 [Streptobacillus moniliformis]SQA13043.1 Uncharacterised protein [Streptobacillus moniliformis]
MEIVKQRLGDLDRAYCASHLKTSEGYKIIVASEAYVNEGRPCYSYGGNDFSEIETMWENGGGCMSIVQIPGKENEIIAIKDFYLKESPSRSRIVWGVYENGTWTFKDIIKKEYMHRFTLTKVDEDVYIVIATISNKKEDKEDWRVPGSIFAGKLPKDLNEKIELQEIKTDLYRNHGFYHDTREGHNEIYFGSDQGIDKLYINGDISNWKFERLCDFPTGEIALSDLDGDGIDEIITIEAFHGDKIRIYNQSSGKLVKVYEYENKIDFAHALIATKFRGVNTFVCGVRRLDSELFYIQYIDGKYVATTIEKGVGTANLDAINLENEDIVIAANHSKNESAIYRIK